jgi:uncharacterized OB-fold protein
VSASPPVPGPPASGLPVPEMSGEQATRPFWDGIRDGRFLLEQCRACEAIIWYPRGFCPRCGAVATRWRPASGRGTVYSYTVARKSWGAFAMAVPYVVAYIELAEGPRILSNVIGVPPEAVRIGLEVEVVFEHGDGGAAAYRFRPVRPTGPGELTQPGEFTQQAGGEHAD